eukprot:185469-Chlamydomonas_euryale.AAC.1
MARPTLRAWPPRPFRLSVPITTIIPPAPLHMPGRPASSRCPSAPHLRGRVRKAAEDGIHVVVVDVGDLDKLGHVNRRHEVWEHLGKVLAGRAVARESCDLDVGVQRTQAHDLGAGIARCAEHGDLGDLTRRSLRRAVRAACSSGSLNHKGDWRGRREECGGRVFGFLPARLGFCTLLVVSRSHTCRRRCSQ